MCSWCWGFRPIWQQTQTLLKEKASDIEIQYVLGGLAPDSDEQMPKELQAAIASYWRRIQEVIPGTKFNHDFWKVCEPRRSTYPSCRAVLAAKRQNPALEDQMIFAIQQAYYLDAKNPSDIAVLVECAESIGLDRQQFTQDIASEKIEAQLQQDIAVYHELADSAGIRGFPSIVVENQLRYHSVNIQYQSVEQLFSEISSFF